MEIKPTSVPINQQRIVIITLKKSRSKNLITKIKNIMKKVKSILSLITLLALIVSCQKTPSLVCESILPQAGIPVPFSILSDSVEGTNGSIECTTKEVEFGPEWREFISLDPQGSATWVGGGLYYPSIESGAYTPITGDRKPITISVSLPGISGSSGKIVDHPSLSSTRTAMNEILQQQIGGAATPAQIAWSQTKIYSERHFKLAIGGNYGNLFFDINAKYNYNSNEVIGRFLFQFTQVYYSVDCDAPAAGISNFFNNPPSCGDPNLGGYSPCYVSSLKYGRKVYLMIESKSYNYSHMADIQASFDAFFSSGGVNVDTRLTKLMQEQSIKGVIIGGPSYEGIQAITDVSGLKKYLLKGANFNISSPGVPLSYTLRFMKDNSVASVVKYDKFTIRECTVIPPTVSTATFTPTDIDDVRLFLTKGDQEFAGHGPIVMLKVSLIKRNSNKELWAVVSIKMAETKSDWTTGENVYEKRIWTAPAGKKIVTATSAAGTMSVDTFTYTDVGPGSDVFSFSQPSRLIKYAKFLGDTYDDDVTNGSISISKMEEWSHLHSLKFNPIKVKFSD